MVGKNPKFNPSTPSTGLGTSPLGTRIRNPKIKKSICLFCSLGCGVAFRTAGEHVTAIDYDKENSINSGSLCPRGNYNFELLNHPQRLIEPQIGKKKVSWSEALSFLGQSLKEFNPNSIGIVLSSNSSNEDACLAAKLAKQLNLKNISATGGSDLEAYQGYKGEVKGAELSGVDEIGKGEALLIIGDILTRSPVLSKRINQVKYGKRGNKIIVVDPNRSHTSWFATTHLKNLPGTEAQVLAALHKIISDKADVDLEKASKACGIPSEELIKAAKDFNSAPSGTIIFVPSENVQRNDLVSYLIKVLAGLSANKKYITFYEYGNTLGVNIILDEAVKGHTSYQEMLKKIEDGQIKSLLVLGEDLSIPREKVKFMAVSSYFEGEADLLLPLASHLEESASYLLADGRVEKSNVVAPRVGAKLNSEIISSLLDEKIEITKEVKETLDKGAPFEKTDLKQKLVEVQKIKAKDQAPELNITHFGNNSLVKRFFWYRVNNKGG